MIKPRKRVIPSRPVRPKTTHDKRSNHAKLLKLMGDPDTTCVSEDTLRKYIVSGLQGVTANEDLAKDVMLSFLNHKEEVQDILSVPVNVGVYRNNNGYDVEAYPRVNIQGFDSLQMGFRYMDGKLQNRVRYTLSEVWEESDEDGDLLTKEQLG